MAQLTTSQIIALARKKLLETSTAIFTDDDLLLYANLTKDDIAKRLFSDDLIVPTTLVFSGGVATKPSDFESHYLSKDSNVPGVGNTFQWVNIEDFRAGKYDRMLCLIAGSIYAYPTNTALTYTDYYKKLPDMSLSVNPTLDASLLECIVYGILYRGFEDLQDFELSKEFRNKFEVEFGIKGQAVSFSSENSQQGGEMFNGIAII